ncbi:MAG: C40 family peptidase [Desulfovibrionaceae bacterium]|nr:C40 family peptidase [Desulfovibrionaceae bacterium]
MSEQPCINDSAARSPDRLAAIAPACAGNGDLIAGPASLLPGRRGFLLGLGAFLLAPGLPGEALAQPGRGGAESLARARAALARGVRQALGRPYVWGAAGPDAFDCSGLLVWLYRQAGVRLPRLAVEQGSRGRPVTDRLRGGDVLLFRSRRSPTGWHTGMYVGAGCFVHASGRKRGVCLSSLTEGRYRRNFAAARRYLPC